MIDMKNKNDYDLQKMSFPPERSQCPRPKRPRWYENEQDALVRVVKNGKLFRAFMQQGVLLSAERPLDLVQYCTGLYKEYVKDPENKTLLKALENAEMEICKVNDYAIASGDLEVLQELECNNELSSEQGLGVYNCCRRGVACNSNI